MMFETKVFLHVLTTIQIQSDLASQEMTEYAKAGSVAEEVLGAVRTVYAFNGQDKEVKRSVSCRGGQPDLFLDRQSQFCTKKHRSR